MLGAIWPERARRWRRGPISRELSVRSQGRPMLSPSRSISAAMLSLAVVAIVAASCGSPGGTPTLPATPSHGPVTIASASASASARSSSASSVPSTSASSSASNGSPTPAASVSDCVPGLGLGHADLALEALLPCRIGGISLERFSYKLADYIGSSNGGDRELYAPWLVAFGLTPDEVTMAVVADLTQQENLVIHAIGVPGVADDKLATGFVDQAKKAGWPVAARTVAGRALEEMVDPAAKAAGSLSVGYVFAKNHILYTIITDDPSLLVESLIKLP